MAKKTTAAAPRYYTKALRCPDGTRKYIRGKTKEELERKVMQAQAELGMGININDATTVVEFAQMWIDVYKKPSVREGSLCTTKGHLNTHILPVIGMMRVRDVKPMDCALVMRRCSHLKKSSASAVRGVMKAMFECAVENNLIVRNPVLRSVVAMGDPPRARVPLTPAQLDQLFDVLRSRPRAKPWHLTFAMLCAYAGLREGEALGLNWDCIDLGAGVLHVRRQYKAAHPRGYVTTELKTESSRRTVPIPPPLLIHLSTLPHSRGDGFLFDVDRPSLSDTAASGMSRLSAVDAKGNPRPGAKTPYYLDFYVHPHLLRHTYATQCFAQGMDLKEVQYLLGHSTPNMTLHTYTHYVQQARLEQTAEKLERVFPAPALRAV